MKKLSLIILGILVVAQFAVPYTMIRGKEEILRNGQVFRFKTRPIDPADPFQGRYVRLGFESDYIPWPYERESELRNKELIYALIEVDQEGFAHFTGWSREKPATGPYLKTRGLWAKRIWNNDTKKHKYLGVMIDMPFDRYYMDEAKAPLAEQMVRDSSRTTNCWANIRILDGKAAIEDVFAEGMSLRDLTAKEH